MTSRIVSSRVVTGSIAVPLKFEIGSQTRFLSLSFCVEQTITADSIGAQRHQATAKNPEAKDLPAAPQPVMATVLTYTSPFIVAVSSSHKARIWSQSHGFHSVCGQTIFAMCLKW